LVALLTDVVKKLIKLTAPLTKKFAVGGPIIETIIAISIIIIFLSLLFFLTGLVFKTKPGKQFQKWLQESFLNRIPMYKTLRGITLQLTGVNKDNYPVVEVNLHGSKARSVGLLTDTLDDGRAVVYLPLAPILNIGQVYIIPKEDIKVIDISLKDASDIITQIGFDAKSVYKTDSDK
jgi:uncharacterized membrane protein